MLEVAGVHKSYGDVTALNGVDLALDAGRCTALLGPNGAGKSTLISCIAGLQRPDAGRITVAGEDVARHPERTARLVGLAPQDTGVYEGLTVRENLAFFTELAGFRGADARARAGAAAEAVALTGLWERTAQSMSGGEKRRLHTACALVAGAPLLLLDEATVGADVATRSTLLAVVADLVADGTAVLYSTHYFPEVHLLGADVAIIDQGQVVAAGPPAGLVARHGKGAIELVFGGEPPDLAWGDGLTVAPGPGPDETLVTVRADEPAQALAHLLGRVGAASERLRAVDLVRPDLDTVFLELTGRRYQADGDPTAEGAEA